MFWPSLCSVNNIYGILFHLPFSQTQFGVSFYISHACINYPLTNSHSIRIVPGQTTNDVRIPLAVAVNFKKRSKNGNTCAPCHTIFTAKNFRQDYVPVDLTYIYIYASVWNSFQCRRRHNISTEIYRSATVAICV